ncbi:uncharacterized protein LOC128215415 [Mya arenaria]|uniref:uncharacterized protein LOC128215415 n=1 Tax=Mya arenaria TaxID=6604 RepID=UPI0022E95C83|nr:uncharacterized protein LOC128215415 [Mya arenaria]
MAGYEMLFLFLGFVFISVQAVPAPGRGALEGYCITSDDCKKGECCISFNTPRGKREALSPDLRKFVDGKCEQLGSVGDKCYVNPLSPGESGLFYDRCPCSSDINCNSDGIILPPIGLSGTCGVKECSQSDDCQNDECCVSKFRPIGKRSLDSANQLGICKPMGTTNSDCLVSNGSGRPKDRVFLHCPCGDAFTCRGIGIRDIPLGALGKCSFRRPFRGPFLP